MDCSSQHCHLYIKICLLLMRHQGSERFKRMLRSHSSRVWWLSIPTPESDSQDLCAGFTFSSHCAVFSSANCGDDSAHGWEFNSVFSWIVFGKISEDKLVCKPKYYCCCCSVAKSCLTLWPHGLLFKTPLSSTISWILLNFMSIELVIPSNHLILCLPLLLLPSIFSIIRVFSSESMLVSGGQVLALQLQQ